jgi:hypothetical protein
MREADEQRFIGGQRPGIPQGKPGFSMPDGFATNFRHIKIGPLDGSDAEPMFGPSLAGAAMALRRDFS